MEVFRNLLDTDLIPDIINLYRSSTNSVIVDNKRTDRYVTPKRGMFLLSKYNEEEFKFVWDNIKDKLPNCNPEIFRILKITPQNKKTAFHECSEKKEKKKYTKPKKVQKSGVQ